MATDSRMTFACPIWSRGLSARLAAGAARMCGPIGNRLKRMPDQGWGRRLDDPMLVEGDADLVRLAPDHVTGNVRAVRLKDQFETLGDVEGVTNVERRPRYRNVADQAVYRAASEFNRSRHQYGFARGSASFHRALIGRNA
jgi:hypothetical protein